MATENDTETQSEGPASVDIRLSLSGKVAERFLAFHEKLSESDDLDHLKYGNLSYAGLTKVALCEWLKNAEAQMNGGRR